MRKLLPILIFSFIYSASTADIYTCEIDGATTFSQIPCGDSDQLEYPLRDIGAV